MSRDLRSALTRAGEDGQFAAEIWQGIKSHTGGWWDCEGCGECYDCRDAHAWDAFERNALDAIHYACVHLAERDSEVTIAARAVVARMRLVYRDEYIERAAREPDSLLALVARLEACSQ